MYDYLYCNEIIYAFSNLNNRFQSILHLYSSYHLNLSNRTIKTKFKLIEQLPLNIEHVKSLTLSNDDCSFIYTQKCLSIYPTIRIFSICINKFSTINISFNIGYNIEINEVSQKILFEMKLLKYFT